MISRTRHRPAFTLLEIAAVMGLLGVLLVFGTATMIGAVKIERAATSVYRKLAAQDTLADQFRADVAAAVDAPARLDDALAGPTCLILRKPDGGSILYRFAADHLERIQSDGKARTSHQLTLGGVRVTIEFHRFGPGNGLLALRLTEVRPRGYVARETEIVAALGGDWR